ncbi:MAG: efflux RND transporter permease subunit [Firmicutes bacterium]|nr:efflux RND transporter permease subunit [Candidatus Fermentithermobacillaceae bacterium]
MSLPAISVRRPVTALMLMLMVIILGVVSYSRLGLDLLPKINPPVAAIITFFQGASPQEVADLVTVPLESAAATVPGTKEITSISQEGISAIIMMFDWGQDMAEAREDISQRIDLVPLPEGADKPVVVEFDPTLLPVMQVSLTAPEGVDVAGLTELATKTIKPRLEGLEGVASVDILGGVTKQVTVKLDPSKLNAYHLTQDVVSAVISASNLNFPLGTVENDGLVLDLRFSGKLKNLDELKDLIVGYVPLEAPVPGMGPQVIPVRLGDVATVEEEVVRGGSIARINGKPSVAMTIQKEGTANTVFVARAVRRELEEISSELGGLDIVISMDQAKFIEEAIGSVADNLLMGAVLAALVLLLFLRDVRSTLVIGISIPFSVIATFVLLYFGKLTLNIMTMGGLALGVGMLVDNSIVVLENIFQHVERGEDPVRAAITGAEEVQMAITASTLTTVVVFLPVVFVGGISGILFKELALTVSFSLLASLVVAVTVVPMLASKLLFRRSRDRNAGTTTPAPEDGGERGRSVYGRILGWCLDHRALFLTVVFVGMSGTVWLLLPKIQTEFLPEADEGAFAITLSMREGTPLERIDEVVRDIEEILDSDDSVAAYSVTIGKPEGLGMLQSFFTGSADARISVKLTDRVTREKATRSVMERIERKVKEVVEDATVTFSPQSSILMMSGSAPGTVEVVVSGPDVREVQRLSEDFATKMASIPGMKAVRSSLTARKPEMMVVVDGEKASLNGLTPAQVALAVSRAVRGQTVSRFEKPEPESSQGVSTQDIVVKFDPESVRDVSDLKNILLWGRSGPVRLRDVASIVPGEGPVVIARNNQKLSARLTGQFAGRSLGSVTEDLVELISETTLPEGYSISIGGLSEIMQEGFSGLRFALCLAVVLVYMIMAASFESLGIPFIIFFTMPLAAVGVLLALYLSGYAFGITAFMGVIVLAGVVVNNGIVLVDFIIQRRMAGLPPREAVIEGSRRRVRPVLMTSLTTILGLIPMALGLGQGGAPALRWRS